MAELCTALSALGHHVELVSTTVDGPGELDVPTGVAIQDDGFLATAFPVTYPREYTFSPALVRWLWRNVTRFDVVHIHSIYRFTTVAAAAVCRKRSVPYVLHPHGALTSYHRGHHQWRKDLYERAVDRPIARGAGTVIWESEREQSEAAATGWPSGSVVWSGVWIPVLSEEDARREGEVVFLGRLAEKKGVDLLIEAFALVLESHPGAHLRIIGPAEEGKATALASRAAELGIAEQVTFEGVLHGMEKDDALRRASIHVAPSADESFGASAIEAMAYSTPVVLTRAFPFYEELEAEGGCVVAERTPEAIAEGISLLLNAESRAEEIGGRGRAFVASRFAWDAIARRLERMYRELSDRTHRSAAPAARSATPAEGEAR
jgi:glycosyltransferase involved in cell wall biosynthesis